MIIHPAIGVPPCVETSNVCCLNSWILTHFRGLWQLWRASGRSNHGQGRSRGVGCRGAVDEVLLLMPHCITYNEFQGIKDLLQDTYGLWIGYTPSDFVE